MGKSRRPVGSTKLLDYVVAATEALGGMTAIATKRNEVVYCAPLMSSWRFVETGRVTQPDLVAAAEQAWATGEHIVRPCHVETTTGAYDVVVHAGVIKRRWVVLSVIDRTQEVQAIQVRRDFVSNIGHELRTPVTSVGLIAQALRSCVDDPQAVRHFAGRLERVSLHLRHLTESMLDLARVEYGHDGARRDRVSVRRVIDRAVGLWVEAAHDRGVSLKVKNKVDVAVIGDEDSLVTALDNLIGNAIYYSTHGRRVVVAARVDQAEGMVSIHVIDQGIGIPEQDRERVFERFYRTDEARSRRAGGTGLGLAIVKHVALSHGGAATVESQVNVGSTFTLTLPIMTKDQGGGSGPSAAETSVFDTQDREME